MSHSRRFKLRTDERWRSSHVNFPKVTARDQHDNISEARIGGVLSCPICPQDRPLAGLSNLIGHLISKDHAYSYMYLHKQHLAGDENAKKWWRFYHDWETGNDLGQFELERIRNNARKKMPEFDMEKLKVKYNCYKDFRKEIAEREQNSSSLTSEKVSKTKSAKTNSNKEKNTGDAGPATVQNSDESANTSFESEVAVNAQGSGPKLGHFVTSSTSSSGKSQAQNQVLSSFRQAKPAQSPQLEKGVQNMTPGTEGPLIDLSEVGKNKRLLPVPQEPSPDSADMGEEHASKRQKMESSGPRREQDRDRSDRRNHPTDRPPRSENRRSHSQNRTGNYHPNRGDYYPSRRARIDNQPGNEREGRRRRNRNRNRNRRPDGMDSRGSGSGEHPKSDAQGSSSSPTKSGEP